MPSLVTNLLGRQGEQTYILRLPSVLLSYLAPLEFPNVPAYQCIVNRRSPPRLLIFNLLPTITGPDFGSRSRVDAIAKRFAARQRGAM